MRKGCRDRQIDKACHLGNEERDNKSSAAKWQHDNLSARTGKEEW